MLPATLESSVGLNTVEDYRKKCHICLADNIGFPTLCNQGDSVEHTFCLECILKVCVEEGSLSAPCPVCRLPFNINDYLISKELHLLQSESMDVAMTYISHMEVNPFRCTAPEHHAHKPLIKYFARGNKKYQQETISKIYWGNNDLFNESIKLQPNSIRIKQNLLEIIGNPWSPELNKQQSDKMLSDIFTNGWLVRPLCKETHETFLHRCHLFIRKVMPLTNLIDGKPYNLYYRVFEYGQFISEYHSANIEQSILNLDWAHMRSESTLANRASTGPLDEELLHPVEPKEERIDWNVLQRIKQQDRLLLS